MGSYKRLKLDKYVCYICGTDKTTLHRRFKKRLNDYIFQPDWRIIDNKPYCLNCYNRIIRKNDPHLLKKRRRRFRFKDQIIITKEVPRIGVCNLCRAVYPFDTSRTILHHEEYDPNDKLKHTLEVCEQCHTRKTWELKQIIYTNNKPKT